MSVKLPLYIWLNSRFHYLSQTLDKNCYIRYIHPSTQCIPTYNKSQLTQTKYASISFLFSICKFNLHAKCHQMLPYHFIWLQLYFIALVDEPLHAVLIVMLWCIKYEKQILKTIIFLLYSLIFVIYVKKELIRD